MSPQQMSPQQINTPTNGVSEKLPLKELSSAISESAGIVSGYLATNHLPQPSFDANGPSVIVPVSAPPNVQLARQKLLSASLELFQLATGPSDFLPNLATGFQYVSCLTWLCQYRIFHLVPLDASISYDALSTASKVSVQRLKAIIRMSMTAGLFREDDAGSVVHSATSAFLARDPVAYSYATHMTSGSAPVAQKMAAAALKWGPDSTQPYETAFNVALDTDLPFFDYLSRNTAKMADFSAYMRNVRSSDNVALRHLTAGFAWEGIRQDGVVVDVGGSTGDAAIALAEAFPHLKLVVQDLPANAENGQKMLSSSPEKSSLAARITFQGHDFMQAQPVRDADVYLLRMILHDWTDAQAVKIVRNLVDAMKDRPSSKLLIMDTVLPKPGSVPVSLERLVRVRDMTMLQSFNSKERDLDDWKALLADVDAGLHLVNVVQPFGSALSVLEVTFGK